MRRLFLCGAGLVLALSARAGQAGTSALMQEAVTAYREGRLEAALLKMGEILGQEPDNPTAKNYVWAIAKRIREDEDKYRLSPREVSHAVALAEKELAERRHRTEAALAEMREAARRSGNVRSPADVLAGAAGLERFIDGDLAEELQGAQARAFAEQVASHLKTALDRKIFVSLKDQYRAEGYLAYARRDWGAADALWEKALKEDPGDKAVARDLESLRAVVRERARRDRVSELANQADLYFRSGRYAESIKAWQDIAGLDAGFPQLAARTAAARAALEKARLQDKLKGMTEEGLVLYRGGDVFSAAQKWLEVLQQDPSHAEARSWLQHAGNRLRASGPVAVPPPAPVPIAKPAAEAPREPVPTATAGGAAKAMSLYKEGMILYAQGDLPAAVRAWEECVRLDPSLGRAREALRQANAELQFK